MHILQALLEVKIQADLSLGAPQVWASVRENLSPDSAAWRHYHALLTAEWLSEHASVDDLIMASSCPFRDSFRPYLPGVERPGDHGAEYVRHRERETLPHGHCRLV